jgi:hypothetical protein
MHQPRSGSVKTIPSAVAQGASLEIVEISEEVGRIRDSECSASSA